MKIIKTETDNTQKQRGIQNQGSRKTDKLGRTTRNGNNKTNKETTREEWREGWKEREREKDDT